MINNVQKLNQKIIIVGAGLTGTLLALRLGQHGFKVDVYEKRADIYKYKSGKKRSLGMSLSTRGRIALKEAGIFHKQEPTMALKKGRATHTQDGKVKYQIYGDGSQFLSTVNRKNVNSLLIDEAIATGNVHFYFNRKVKSIYTKCKKITFLDTTTDHEEHSEYSYLFGADGANSTIRELLFEQKIIHRKRRKLFHIYKEMNIPAGPNGEYVLEPNYVHIWSSEEAVFVALPTLEKSFISTIFYRNEGQLSTITDPAELHSYFKKHFPHLYKVLPTIEKDFFENPGSEIFQIECSKWNYKDNVLLIGDSAHAFAPFYAMGMNTCFEDCSLYMEFLKKNNFDFGEAIIQFSQLRKKDVDAMQSLTNHNYHNLHFSKQASFDLRWQLERKIWKAYPDLYVPEYCMVAFSQIPFSEVVERTVRNKKIIDKICLLYLKQITQKQDFEIDLFIESDFVKNLLLSQYAHRDLQKVPS